MTVGGCFVGDRPEITGPVFPTCQRFQDDLGIFHSPMLRDPKDYAAGRRQPHPKCKLSEIFVESHHDSRFSHCSSQNNFIRFTT